MVYRVRMDEYYTQVDVCFLHMCVCVCVCVCACVCACVRACVRVCVCCINVCLYVCINQYIHTSIFEKSTAHVTRVGYDIYKL